ncbi:MAG: redoxin domain-containing protein [Solirubrobacteraceae bacterium]
MLLHQNLFTDASFPDALQLKLGTLLSQTAAARAPVRVAIISARGDLETSTAFWGNPQPYATHLARELSPTYSGRLLVVMPDGFGVAWRAKANGAAALTDALGSLSISGDGAGALYRAADRAVHRLEAAAGVGAATLARERLPAAITRAGGGVEGSTPAARSGTAAAGHRGRARPGAILILVAVLLLVAYVMWRRRIRLPRLRLGRLRGVRIRPIALLPTLLLAIVVAALVLNRGSAPATGSLDSNPNLDGGTQVPHPRPAPNFTLTDETGRRVSLSQFRGKVVVLAFVDAECTTDCPLTTTMLLEAKRDLGTAGRNVQLLGVNANWRSTQIYDVLNYTELHGMLGKWHFLTGPPAQLEPIWRAYGVNEQVLEAAGSDAIDHVPDFDVIDQRGRLRTIYTESSSYAAIPQQAQLLAQEISSLLPSHPHLSSQLGYAQVRGTGPAQSATLPRAGGGTLTLRAGSAHLLLFFATWDTQTTPIAAQLSALNAYSRAAARKQLPPLTAVDEGSVEPSAAALPAFLKSLGEPLRYPVAIDTGGKLADGYEVQGQPWFVLSSASGQIVWYDEVPGWPTLHQLEHQVRAALAGAPTPARNAAAVRRDLAGSPAPLAALHAQSSKLLPGGTLAFYRRLAALRGHAVVINIWYSTCAPCQKEFGLFANASAEFGGRVGFLGADIADPTALGQAFLRQNPVSYPSYRVGSVDLDPLLAGGLQATPTTVYLSPRGRVIYVHQGQYMSQGSLDADIESYALGG